MFDKEEIKKMFEIGYKIEIIPADSPLKDVFQPMITLKIGSFYEEFCVLDDFFEVFGELIRGLQVGTIEEMAFFFFEKEQLKRFSIIEEVKECNENEECYKGRLYLNNYPVIYDKKNNIVNIHVKEKLKKQMQKLVNRIYKNIIPLFAKDFSVKAEVGNVYMVVLFLYYGSGEHKEFEIEVPYHNFIDCEIDFFDILKTLINIYKLKNLPDDLNNFIEFIEGKIKE